MPQLSDILLAAENQANVIRDSVKLIEEHVQTQGGITGMAIKTVFKLVKTVKENVLEELLQKLLPEFSKAMNPIYEKFQAVKNTNFETFINQNAEEVVQQLLSITDAKAARAENKVLKSGYEKLRGMAEKQVKAAVPGIAKLVATYLPKQD